MILYVELDDKSGYRYLTSENPGKLVVFIEKQKLQKHVNYLWRESEGKIHFKEYNGFWENIDHKPEKLKYFVMARLGAVNIEDINK